MIRITDLMMYLEAVRAEHGDLPIITPGFDESNYDYCYMPDIVHVVPVSPVPSHSGALREVGSIHPEAQKCVAITF